MVGRRSCNGVLLVVYPSCCGGVGCVGGLVACARSGPKEIRGKDYKKDVGWIDEHSIRSPKAMVVESVEDVGCLWEVGYLGVGNGWLVLLELA
ncbi:unnamed protein product [Dovyalis caffra]|uniref:Uncharacterized protein n=1 Tax=Dovyalis caffra TaxID=77055 RepID=A0AAV1RR02_9ROSI|nr:unnamed protein product [Dovyalis caffra]